METLLHVGDLVKVVKLSDSEGDSSFIGQCGKIVSQPSSTFIDFWEVEFPDGRKDSFWTEELTDEVYDVISPDGFSIHCMDTYNSLAEAEIAFEVWTKNYAAQGFYSSADYGRIPLDELRSYCKIIPQAITIDED